MPSLSACGREAKRRDDDIAFIARERRQQIGKGQHLDLAADAQFRAHRIGEFDIEAGQSVGFVAIMEGREAVVDQDANRAADRFGPLCLGIDKAKERHGIGGLGALR